MTDFGDKEFPGVGYPTPVSIPDETTCLTLQVPANAEWWALVIGVLYTLTLEWEWQQFEGGLDRDVAAARWITMLNDAMATAEATNSCLADAPAPYWDDEDAGDADDEESTAVEDWYGEVTYSESGVPEFNGNRLEDWLIAGFIAIVAGENKAVRFLTAAKRFRLYLRAGDFGGTVKVFLNGILGTLVDTYSTSPGLRTVDVITDGVPALGMGAEDALVEMIIVQDVPHEGVDVPQLQIVRKRLWAGEIAPINTRYDVDCNCVQVTYDDGDTWHQRDQADPRHGTSFQVPPLDTEDARCAAAAGMVELVRRCVNQVVDADEIVLIASGILDILAVLSGGPGIIIDLIVAVVEALLAIGGAVLDAAFDDAAYERILGYFYCNIEDDGTVTADDFTNIMAAIEGEPNSIVYDALQLFMNLYGEVQLTDAGVKFADHDADCSAIECPCANELVFDLTTSDGGFVNVANVWGQMHTNLGVYSSGVGWTTTDVTFYGAAQRALDIGVSFSEVNVIKVIIEFDITVANYDEILVEVSGSSGLVFAYDPINPTPPHSSGSLVVYNSGSGGLGNHITIAACPGYSPPSGSFVLTKVTICYD